MTEQNWATNEMYRRISSDGMNKIKKFSSIKNKMILTTLIIIFVCVICQSISPVFSPTYEAQEALPTLPKMDQTATAIPTKTIFLPSVTTTQSMPTPTATVIQIPTICECSGDIYNCGDFQKQSEAQKCFNYCVDLGRGDVHRLDSDNDGLACESLP